METWKVFITTVWDGFLKTLILILLLGNIKRPYNHCQRHLVKFWYFHLQLWSTPIITKWDCCLSILIFILGNVKCSNNRRKVWLVKKVILTSLYGNLQCPYDKRVKLLLKKGMLIILLRNLKHTCSHRRIHLVKKSCWHFCLENLDKNVILILLGRNVKCS